MNEPKESDENGTRHWLQGPLGMALGGLLALVTVGLDLYLTGEQLSSEAPYPNRRITIVVPFTQGVEGTQLVDAERRW